MKLENKLSKLEIISVVLNFGLGVMVLLSLKVIDGYTPLFLLWPSLHLGLIILTKSYPKWGKRCSRVFFALNSNILFFILFYLWLVILFYLWMGVTLLFNGYLLYYFSLERKTFMFYEEIYHPLCVIAHLLLLFVFLWDMFG
jgi:hypothetical protein